MSPPEVKPAFTFISKNGDTLSSNNLKGRITCVYFWSSWNPACRKLNPELVKVYETYRVKLQKSAIRFDIASVSIDTRKELWEVAIKQDYLHWKYHFCDFKGWDSPLVKEFKVGRIPTNILLNENGEVVGKDLFGKALEQKLDSLLVSN